MSEDLISLLIYVALGLVGVIATAYKNKKKQQATMTRPPRQEVPHTFPADPATDFGPELRPLIELFNIPKQKAEPEYETIESGPSVEESGMDVDTEVASNELSGMKVDTTISSVEKPISDVESFEEGQSDIQKMIAKYEAIRKELEDNDMGDDIARGEIVSVEAEEAAREKRAEQKVFFEARKAIIYSEILKRREY